MPMKKMIVYESLSDFQKSKGEINESGLNEGFGPLKNAFKKIGKFFVALFNKLPISGVISPVNIGIMVKNKNLSPAISFLPSKSDLSIEPGLSSLTEKELFNKRGGEDSGDRTKRKVNEAKVELSHPNKKQVANVGKEELERKIRIAIKNPLDRPLMIWGAPGIGKTAIVKAVLEARGGGRLIDVQTAKMAPDDWTLPYIVKEEVFSEEGEDGVKKPSPYKLSGIKPVDVPKSWLPTYIMTGDPEEDKRRDDLANLGEGGVLFLDELSRARSSVQNTCLKLIGERIIGDSKLGSKWTIISASNRMSDDPAGEQQWSTALGNRFQQLNYVPSFKDWKEWAINKIDQRILDFLEFHQEFFYTLDSDTDELEGGMYASPRSWEAASDAIKAAIKDAEEEGTRISTRTLIDEVSYNVGADIAQEIGAFFRLLESFTKEDIREVLTHPEKARMPKKSGSGYDPSEASALISIICTSTRGKELTVKEFENYIKYLIRLDNGSLAVWGLKTMIGIHPYINEEIEGFDGKDKYKKPVDDFIAKYGDIF